MNPGPEHPEHKGHRFWSLTQKIEFPGFVFRVHWDGQLYLQVASDNGTCNVTGAKLEWKGRKWRLSEHMTDTEFVWTCFKAVLTAIEHETRELFKFDGVAVADSHVNIHQLADFLRDGTRGDGRE